jgi:hypothetical protein
MTPSEIAANNAALIMALTAAIYRPLESPADFLEQVTNELMDLAPTLHGAAKDAVTRTAELLLASEQS